MLVIAVKHQQEYDASRSLLMMYFNIRQAVRSFVGRLLLIIWTEIVEVDGGDARYLASCRAP